MEKKKIRIMERIKSFQEYIEYAKATAKKLSKSIEEKGIDKSRIIIDYIRRDLFGQLYEFDLVVLKEEGQGIQDVYEIKTKSTVERNFNEIKYQLEKRKSSANAEHAYVVYCDDNKLTIIGIDEEKKINKKEKKEHKATSFETFYKIVSEVCGTENIDSRFFFRGHSSIIRDCKSGIYRDENLIKNEDRIFHDAVRKCPDEFLPEMSTFDTLVKMQHYELPTRLLDITENPLVALYFACCNQVDVDGEVLIFSVIDENIKYYDSDTVCLLSNLSKMRSNFDLKADRESLEYNIRQEKSNFNASNLDEADLNRVICVLPKLNNERIKCQQGAFFIFGINGDKMTQSEMKDNPTKIIISAQYKTKILKELDLLGINESSLFPETDKIMKNIKKGYVN